MTVRKTLLQGDPLLHQACREVMPGEITGSQVQQVLTDLVDTMRSEGLIAMAAPQIGVDLQIFVSEIRATPSRPSNELDELRVYINPKLLKASEASVELYEGCGSVTGEKRFGPVLRPQEITIRAQAQDGKEYILTCNGLLARAIQHEIDHLNGGEFTSKMSAQAKLVTPEEFREQKSSDPKHQEATKTTIKSISFSTSA